MYSDARNTYSKEQHWNVASQRKGFAKSDSHVLSCLDTRKNQRRTRLKSPTRWVPRGWNCHAIQFATPAAWLMWYRLLDPPPRSTPDPLSGQAFMPLLMAIPVVLRFSLITSRRYKRYASASSAWQRVLGILSFRASRGISINKEL